MEHHTVIHTEHGTPHSYSYGLWNTTQLFIQNMEHHKFVHTDHGTPHIYSYNEWNPAQLLLRNMEHHTFTPTEHGTLHILSCGTWNTTAKFNGNFLQRTVGLRSSAQHICYKKSKQ